MRKWVFGAVIVAILAVGVIIRIPKNYEPRRPEVELVVQDHSYEETRPAEPLGPEVDPFPSEHWAWVKRPKWPDWVKFYRKKVLFTRTSVTIDFAHYDDMTTTGEGDSVQTSPYNIPILIGDGKGLALVRLISYYEGPPGASAVFYDPYGNIIGECDNLLGDLPTFDPTGKYFLVEYGDGEALEIGPIRVFDCSGKKLFDLNQEDVNRDLHRVIPTFEGTAYLSISMSSSFAGFSDKRSGILGVVVITHVPDRFWHGITDPYGGPTYMLLYDVKRNVLGAVRLRYLHEDAIEGLARKTLSDPSLIAPKGAPVPFLTEACDSTTGLLKKSDGSTCYRIFAYREALAGIELGKSTVGKMEALLGRPTEVTSETLTEGISDGMATDHHWVYQTPDGKGSLTIEFLARAEYADLSPDDPIEVRSVLVMGRGFEYSHGVEPSDSTWGILEKCGPPTNADSKDDTLIDFTLTNGAVVGAQLHYGSKP